MTVQNDLKLNLGISSCLLGEKVRYDGGHKRDHYLNDILGAYTDWVAVCPEKECGLSVPREAMHLVDDDGDIKLITIKSKKDITPRMNEWIRLKIEELRKKNLCGYIFKAKSPSSGMRDIKIYNKKGEYKNKKGVGLFAREFMDSFPLLPVEDEGRLHDPVIRENFIERIFIYRRWQNIFNSNLKVSDFIEFHMQHKLLIMAHKHSRVSDLGKIIAGFNKKNIEKESLKYIQHLMDTLKIKATVNNHVNVLYHILGYFKKDLDSFEKKEVIEVIEQYHQRNIPLIVPQTLINHFVNKYKKEYLQNQYYLKPHPLELKLRNHV